MPGYNHYLNCTCGWCLKTGSSFRTTSSSQQNIGDSLSPRLYTKKSSYVSSTPHTDEAKTYETQCWWCDEEVFYHTNGYGDSVLFDSLGKPWKVHSCWLEYRNSTSKPKILEESLQRRRCLMLAGALNKIKKEKGVATEETLANEMGITVDELKKYYANYYVIYPKKNGRIGLLGGF